MRSPFIAAAALAAASLAVPVCAQPVLQAAAAAALTTATTTDTPAPAPAPAAPAPGPEDRAPAGLEVASGLDMVVVSAYVWRGFVLVDDAALQPNAWLKVGNLTLTSWMNVASTCPNGDHLTEHDFTADYTIARGKTSFSAGYVNYLFPDLDTDRVSHEIYAGVAHASYFAPALRVYHDVHVGSGTYVSLAASHTYALPWRDAALTPSLALGYNHRQWIDDSTFSDLALGLKARVPTPLPRVALTPFVTWSRSLATAHFPSRFVYGVGMSVQ